MMKQYVIFAVTTFLLVLSFRAESAAGWQFADADGRKLEVTEVVKQLKGYDVIFFDEFHDQKAIHEAQRAFLAEFYEANPNLAVSLEMFECDVQEELNRYLEGTLTEAAFLEQSRPWSNYQMDYRPLIEFSKENKVPVLAANVPRRLASQYAKSGRLDGISKAQQRYLPRVHRMGSKAYYEKFTGYMRSGQIGMKLVPQQIDLFYQAQCLKDDKMAESIADFVVAHPGRRILHVQGEFHGRAHLGVVEKLRWLKPQLKIAVIAPVAIAGEVKETLRNHDDEGDLFLLYEREEKMP